MFFDICFQLLLSYEVERFLKMGGLAGRVVID
jgi:hypothetical protein